MKIYIVRHGQTDFNVQKRFQDSKSELSDEGIRQAEVLALRFQNIPIDKIISSPYKRTRHTAEIISKHINKDIEFNDLFHETIAPSEFIGKERMHPEVQEIIRQKKENIDNVHYRHSDEETIHDIKIRCLEGLEFLKIQGSENILVVTHGAIINALVCLMMFGENVTGDEYIKFTKFHYMENTGITLVTYNEDWRLETWNDKAHLG